MDSKLSLKEKIYTSDKTVIRESILKALGIVAAFDVFMYFLKGAFEFPLLVVFLSFIMFLIFMAGFGVVRNNKVFFNENEITFQALYNPGNPTRYKWKNINMIIIGDVEVKHSRIPYTVFGIQIFYLENLDSNSTSNFEVYSLKHLVNYDDLIEEIKKISMKYDIRLQDNRENPES